MRRWPIFVRRSRLHAKVGLRSRLATCGWVLGPPQQPALFDRILPKEMPMSCISRQVGQDAGRAGLRQRGKGGRNGPFPGWKTTRA